MSPRMTSPDKQAPQDGAEAAQYLTFTLEHEVFAIGILSIKEIIDYAPLTKVPMMPECVRGVINLRGSVVPVMDLRARFGRGPSPITKRTCIVIVEMAEDTDHRVIGVLVDSVNAVLEIGASDIEPPPAFGTRVRGDFIRGMGKLDGRFVVILDTEQTLSTAEIESLATSSSDTRAAATATAT
jgi:purine-binding chemotaxis protein CheW